MEIKSTKDQVKTKEQYYRENCDICSNRFECGLVTEYDAGKKVELDKCRNFDDVFAK